MKYKEWIYYHAKNQMDNPANVEKYNVEPYNIDGRYRGRHLMHVVANIKGF